VLESGHFRQPQAGLRRHEDKRVIAAPEPSLPVGRSKQRIHFGPRQKTNQSPCEALAGNGQHALDLCGMSWGFKGCVTKEGINRSQA